MERDGSVSHAINTTARGRRPCALPPQSGADSRCGSGGSMPRRRSVGGPSANSSPSAAQGEAVRGAARSGACGGLGDTGRFRIEARPALRASNPKKPACKRRLRLVARPARLVSFCRISHRRNRRWELRPDCGAGAACGTGPRAPNPGTACCVKVVGIVGQAASSSNSPASSRSSTSMSASSSPAGRLTVSVALSS